MILYYSENADDEDETWQVEKLGILREKIMSERKSNLFGQFVGM